MLIGRGSLPDRIGNNDSECNCETKIESIVSYNGYIGWWQLIVMARHRRRCLKGGSVQGNIKINLFSTVYSMNQ